MRPVRAALAGFILFAAACASVSGAPGVAQAAFGEPFTLKPGESASVGTARVLVGFDRVSADSRCPRDVQCIQAGEATVLAWITVPRGQREDVTLMTRPGQETATAGGYTLTLTNLEPVPLASRPTRPSDYRATFTLNAAAPTP